MKRFVFLLFSLVLLPVFNANAVDVYEINGWMSPDVARENVVPKRATTTSYAMKVVVSMPTGSAGATIATGAPTNTKFSPCTAANTKIDLITVTLTYNATGLTVVDKDVYVFFFNPEGATKFYVIKKPVFPLTTATVVSRATAALIAPATDIYSAIAAIPSGNINETVEASLPLLGAASGIWQVVGIVAANATFAIDDVTTWSAWDVATFMVMKPWLGAANQACV